MSFNIETIVMSVCIQCVKVSVSTANTSVVSRLVLNISFAFYDILVTRVKFQSMK